MRVLICLMCVALLFCGCSKKYESGKAPGTTQNTAESKAETALIGRWQQISQTQNGETKDTQNDKIYYVFSAGRKLETYYLGTNMGVYSGYEVKDDKITLKMGENGSVTLEYTLNGDSLVLTVPNGDISTAFRRVADEI